jgi:hypothetical protein
LWSAFKSELAAARGTSAEPVRTAAPSAVEAAPATSPATHKKRSAKEEPFDLLSYVKKKIAPDAKPEKKKPHS